MSGWDDNAGTETRPIGDVLDGLGVKATLAHDELAAGAEHLRERADGLDRLQRDLGFPVRSHGEPVTLNAEQYRAAANVLDDMS